MKKTEIDSTIPTPTAKPIPVTAPLPGYITSITAGVVTAGALFATLSAMKMDTGIGTEYRCKAGMFIATVAVTNFVKAGEIIGYFWPKTDGDDNPSESEGTSSPDDELPLSGGGGASATD